MGLDSNSDGKNLSGRASLVLSSRGRRAGSKGGLGSRKPATLLQASCECRDGFDVRDAEDLGPPGPPWGPRDLGTARREMAKAGHSVGSQEGCQWVASGWQWEACTACTGTVTSLLTAFPPSAHRSLNLAVFLARPSASTASPRQTPKHDTRRSLCFTSHFTEPPATGCTRASRRPCRGSRTPRPPRCQNPASHRASSPAA